MVRIVVPFAAGGPVDIVARHLAEELKKTADGNYFVENRPGASGTVGTAAAAKLDWRETLLVTNAQIVVNPAIQEMPYRIGRDLHPAAGISENPLVLAVPAAKNVNRLADFIANAKANPGKFNVATSGNGSLAHLATEQLKSATGASLTHVPFKGAGPAVADMASNRVDAAVVPLTAVRSQVDAGKARLLAVFSERRVSGIPDVPTVAEVTRTQVSAADWIGVFTTADTPPPCRKSVGEHILRVTSSPQFRSSLERYGLVPAPRDADAFTAQLRGDFAKYARTVKEAGIKPQ